MKGIRIFLLVLIVIGLGLLCTQKLWVSGLVDKILASENFNKENSIKIIPSKTASSTAPVNVLDTNFELLTQLHSLTFGQALDIARYVAGITGIRPAFLLAISQEELMLEKTDMCYVTDLKTGAGIRVADGETRLKTMPARDLGAFLAITKSLGKDPLQTQVTCPMSFGWGGAMGPADFIPSTWMLYKDRIEKITGKASDPWDIHDAFLAEGLFLADTGARSQTHDGEWRASMVYFSGSPKSGYTFYADGALVLADKIQATIDGLSK